MRAFVQRVSIAVVLSLSFLWVVSAWAQGGAKGKKPAVSQQKFAAHPGALQPWEQVDVDSAIPPVEPGVTCPSNAVVKSAGDRAKDLVSSLPRFTATERMEHYESNAAGDWGTPTTVTFNYVVEMQQVRPGMLVMEETRDGRKSLERFPAHLATMGLPAVAMVFHPFFVGDYAMTCEGLGKWDGRSAWQIHFQLRPGKFPRLRGYRIKENVYGLKLKGRAWVDAATFQVLHIDTDLMEPVPEIPLLREHLSVDYRPVHFKKENEDLWLQQSAEVFMDYRGHHYRRKHTFSDFMLFTVDVNQKDVVPAETQNH